jgi:hypothetical protein
MKIHFISFSIDIVEHLILLSRKFDLNCFFHRPNIIATSDFATDIIFLIWVLNRETFTIIEVALSTTIISPNILTTWDYSISLLFSKQEMICCFACSILLTFALSVLDFIFMMILFMRCLNLLHENGGVSFYFYSTNIH